MQQTAPTETTFFESVVNAFPSPVFVVNEHMEIVAKNTAALQFFGRPEGRALGMSTGQLMHCVNSGTTKVECGIGKECKGCVIRDSVQAAVKGGRVTRRRCRMRVTQGQTARDILLLVTTTPFHASNQPLVLLILEDMSELAELKALIPICAGCKKIRDDQEYWHQVEEYLQDHLDLQFSHGLCPECVTRLYPKVLTPVS